MSDVKPGLEGVVAGETAIRSVRPEGELGKSHAADGKKTGK